ncbi:MAG: TetR/AcrR family transcriptional regulator, partial [Treponema sp.]|nr:TetR/AcrR family transcriptional regulator [Treponema sp.]
MDFIRARTEKQISSRQREIINACDALFSQLGYEGVTIKAISEMTSFKRTTIYLYYKTKDEALLDLLKREMLDWKAAMEERISTAETMTKEQYCDFFTNVIAAHDKMLKLYCILTTNIENQCGLEKLTDFKRETLPVFDVIRESLDKFFPHASNENKAFFMTAFLANMLGLYPLVHPTKKQKEAMKLAGNTYIPPDFKDT